MVPIKNSYTNRYQRCSKHILSVTSIRGGRREPMHLQGEEESSAKKEAWPGIEPRTFWTATHCSTMIMFACGYLTFF